MGNGKEKRRVKNSLAD